MSETHEASQPSLLAVRAFEAAGRLNSFTLAARELGLTQSAISRHIRALEERFGQTLFHRHGRHITVTELGRAYLSELSAGLDRIRAANTRMASSGRSANRVTVSMLPSVAALWLAPRLHEFTEAYPGVDLRIHAARALVDFDRDHVDLAIRYGRGTWLGCRSVLLAEETLTPVCSPELAERHHLHSAREHLLGARLLLDDIPNGWEEWLNSVGLDSTLAKFGPAFDEGSALYGAAVAGVGVALGRGLLVRNHLREGRLIAPVEQSIRAAYSYWLVSPAKSFTNPASRALVSWLHSIT